MSTLNQITRRRQIILIFSIPLLHLTVIEKENYIVGGSTSGPGQLSFLASLRTIFNTHQCGGCIIELT